MKKNKRRTKRGKKSVSRIILKIVFLLLFGWIYFIYFIIKSIHTLIGKAFLNLPRITRVLMIYSMIGCAGMGVLSTYQQQHMYFKGKISAFRQDIDLEPLKKYAEINVVYAKTKPKPKPKPKVVKKETPQTQTQPQTPVITASANDYQRYAHDLCINTYGWSENDFTNLVKLWNRESGWRPSAHNPSSGAHGIPQSLPASKMATEGADYYTNGYTQIRWGLKYIKGRYGTPSNAWAHSESYGWY